MVNKDKIDCRNCKHFRVCRHMENKEGKRVLIDLFSDDVDNPQEQSWFEWYDYLAKRCRYFETNAYANTSNKK